MVGSHKAAKIGLFSSKSDLRELENFKNDLQLESDDKIWQVTPPASAHAMRKKLDDGRLFRVLDEYQDNIDHRIKPGERRPWRTIILLLGACAIGLGCKLPDGLLKRMADNRHTVRTFDQKAKDQIRAASKAYAHRSLYDYQDEDEPAVGNRQLATPDYEEDDEVIADKIAHSKPAPVAKTIDLDKEGGDEEDTDEDKHQGTIEVAPGSKFTPTKTAKSYHLLRSLDSTLVPTPSKSTASGCLYCKSAGYGDGMPLLVCGACKDAIYCGETCQRKHWVSSHLDSCRPIVTAPRGRRKAADVEEPAGPATKKRKRT